MLEVSQKALVVKSGICICAVVWAVAVAGCGRTDLELSGSGGQDAAFGPGGRDGGIDAVAGHDAGGSGGSGGRVAGTGGTRGTGGLTGSGGRAGTGGRTATGGTAATGGRVGTGGRAATAGSGGTVDAGVRDATPERPAADAPGPDLPPSTPGTLTCGTQSCDTKSQSCCVSIALGAVGAECIPITSTCGGAALVCDEPADCPGGTCCFGLQTGGAGGVAIGSRCVASNACAGIGRFVVCRTNNDCARPNPACCVVAGGVPVCQPACR